MPSEDAADAAPYHDGRKRYAIDVRLFLLTITTAMAMSFTAGVMFGPTPEDFLPPDVASSAVPPAEPEVVSSPEEVRSYVPPSDFSIEETGTEGEFEVKQPRRLPTEHAGDLGYKVRERHVNFEKPSYEDLGDGNVRIKVPSTSNLTDEGGEAEHQPAGQHLLVDIKNIEAAFLNSEDRLAKAMVDVVRAGGLTLLSYHCHSLQPAGVSCVGVLLESHISFHTWPDEGVITLDLFTCGSNPLLPVVPVVEELFGIPRVNATTGEKEEVVTLWSHELRGFRSPADRAKHYLDDQSDLAYWVTSPLEVLVKKNIISVQSPYQHIDIWDVLDIDDTPSHKDAVRHGLKEGDPRWLSNEIASPERLLFLDGILQSMAESEREYHESLVQPAMFAHPHPRRVAIIGGGEGATLREVLKHNTIEKVTMLELDEMMVDIAREHLPFMSDCSDLEGRSTSCFDDPLAELAITDGVQWFLRRWGDEADVKPEGELDVIILDALDPEDHPELSKNLYNDLAFINALYSSLSEEGVIAIQIGTAPSIHDPKADIGIYAARERLINILESHPATAAVFVYEEAHCGFNEPHSFLVACRDASCRKRWYAESDAIDFQVYERIIRTKSGEHALVHFDGSTQLSFQMPPRAWETVYCRREPTPFECAYRGLDTTKVIHDFVIDDEEASSFEVRTVKDEETGEEEPAVFATCDITKGSYIMAEDLASSFVVSDESLENLRGNTQIVGTGQVVVIEDFLEFIEEHGHKSFQEGSNTNLVEVGGTFMIRTTEDKAEANVERWMPSHPSGKIPVYSPVYERHRRSFDVFLVASRDIKEGEELFKHDDVWQW